MIKTSDVIDYAKYGELKQLAIKTDTPSIYSFINLGVIELYKRFNISLKIETIKTHPGVKVYELRNTDINQVLVIYNSEGKPLTYKRVSGEELYDITQLSPTSFLFKNPKEEEIFFLYKASPKKITDPEDVIEIPTDMLEALLNYIGYKGQATMNKQNNIQTPLVNFYDMFEKSCFELEQRGYGLEMFDMDRNIQDKGFI